MSSELRLKKLRGSGGYVMASINDDQQMKGNLGGPDLFLAPIGRLDAEKISKHFCNTCEKEFEGAPKIEFENPNEEVAENLILAEKGQYICNSCNSSIAEYREFKKQDEEGEVGIAKPLEQVTEPAPVETPQEKVTQPGPTTSVSTIEGRAIFDENANKVGVAKQVGIDSTQAMVLIITKNDGTEGSILWSNIRKIGEVILLGNPEEISQPGKCLNCGFVNKQSSKFCEECGTKIQ
ncbi:hypothetical protein [Nitrosopumilus sp.]|uniref:hypothetical protein n=1 Tax=Nitrosopumilus sp. TaxID=2024843 RepID=UPI00292DDFC6|nr:hypothetical protein [Nitrosopumilus sp.]